MWGLKWRSVNRLDGKTEYIMFNDRLPLLFVTRREARAYARQKYGYIRDRLDLRREPCGWRMPRPVKVVVREQ